ncbi:MAG: VapC toxin protein [uncultured Sulfurovum sp.]|uniref:VapC toxin protein n=1 Tax=uncultured Sulfurovum sp. TaxID=269237 RepID=A0A6S6SYQ1_9BACT|nr:MAG: VapC toxin protein [uncultured Sulfurovum sp.]
MLDTNICIYIIKNKPQSVKEKFREFEIGELCISSITVSELMYGAFKSQFVEKNLRAIQDFLMPFEIVDYDYEASVEYGKIRAYLEKKGQVIGNMDMQIAGHALALDLVLVTNNTKEFVRVEGLALDNWV